MKHIIALAEWFLNYIKETWLIKLLCLTVLASSLVPLILDRDATIFAFALPCCTIGFFAPIKFFKGVSEEDEDEEI